MFPYVLLRNKSKRKEYQEQEIQQLNLQFKDAMTALSFSLNVGYSIENALKEAVKELTLLYGADGRIVKEFQNMTRRMEHNENIEDVFLEFAMRSKVDDIVYFAQILQYAKRSGGDLIAIVRNTAATISKKIEVETQIQTTLSGKKMEQRAMAVMPYGIILYLRLSSPEFINPLYGNLFGVFAMGVCLAVYLCANRIARRILAIRV